MARIVAAFLLGPLAGALAFAIASPIDVGPENPLVRVLRTTLAYAVLGAYPTTLVFGVPVFLVLNGRVRPTVIKCCLIGGILAAAPWLGIGLKSTPLNAYLQLAGELATFGAVGGAAFWLVLAGPFPGKTRPATVK
jgi:hypothetical protein